MEDNFRPKFSPKKEAVFKHMSETSLNVQNKLKNLFHVFLPLLGEVSKDDIPHVTRDLATKMLKMFKSGDIKEEYKKYIKTKEFKEFVEACDIHDKAGELWDSLPKEPGSFD